MVFKKAVKIYLPDGYDIGSVRNGDRTGTSIATPFVAGAAAVLKDAYLTKGRTWINSPGRLHTVMLAMADRSNSSGSKSTSGVDDIWGMGRLKMRRLAEVSGGYGFWTKTFTSSSGNYVRAPFGSSPLPAGTDFLKCVMFEHEDMSAKTTVGDKYLKVYADTPSGGVCPSSPAPSSLIGIDSSYDLKHMVSYSSSLANKCIFFEIVNSQTAGSSLTVNTFCYYGDQDDSYPN